MPFDMFRTWQITKRELWGYFFSPIAYVVIIAFWIFSGVFFWSSFFLQGQAEMRTYFGMLPWMLTFLMPAITMRLFAEEKSEGSYEMLLTLPIGFVEIILGKFIAAVVFGFFSISIILLYAISISFLGDLDWGPIWGGFLGSFLLIGFYSSVGLFTSSLTKNQIIAFLTGLGLCLTFFIADKFLFFLPEFFIDMMRYVSTDYHFKNIGKGVIDSRDITFFFTFIAIFFMATYFSLKRQFDGK